MRKVIKNIFFTLLCYSGLLQVYIVFILKRREYFPAVIINYHKFVKSMDGSLDTEPTVTHLIDDFRKELKFIKRYFDILPLDEIAEVLRQGRKFDRPTVAITIDDGYKDSFDLLFPVIRESGVPVTIFLTAGIVGTNEKIWVDRLSEAISNTQNDTLRSDGLFKEEKSYPLDSLEKKRRAYREILNALKDMDIKERDKYLAQLESQLGSIREEAPNMLNWEEVKIMHQNNISFGAHTRTHPILTNMPLEDAKREIADSKNIIEEQLEIKVRHFAYPNGRQKDFNEELRGFCKDIGFESISTCDFGNNNKPSDIFALKRVGSYVPISAFAVNLVRSFLNES